MRLLSIAILALWGTLFSSQAFSAPLPKKILVSIGDFKENNSLQWKKETCAQIYAIANQVSDTGVDVTCRSFDTNDFLDKFLNQAQKDNAYHIRILRGYTGEVTVDVHNWQHMHESDFKDIGWKFKDDAEGKIKKEEAMAKALANFFFFAANEEAFKAGLLVNGIAESQQISYDQEKGVFRDKLTNEAIPPMKAYAIYEGESERKKEKLLAHRC